VNIIQIDPEDPRLTALVLGELSPGDAAAVRRAAEADASLAAALAELETTTRLVEQNLAFPAVPLDSVRRAAVLQAARDADAAAKVVSIKTGGKTIKRLWMGLAAAAAVALLVAVLGKIPAGEKPIAGKPVPADPDEVSFEIALVPAPGPPMVAVDETAPVRVNTPVLVKAADFRSKAMEQKGELFLKRLAECVSTSPIPKEADFPQLRQREEVAVVSQPSMQLPVQAGVSSLIWITRMIREDAILPPANAVRIEEILNRFSLRPIGSAAVSKGVSLSIETTACPWKPSAVLMLVSFRGANDAARDVKARFLADPAKVRSYRLIGFSSVSELDAAPMPTRLPAGTLTSLVIEIDPSTPAADFGSIEWSVDGASAPTLALARDDGAEPSDDVRFAALVCAYGQWLSNRSGGEIDKDMLAAMARETFSTNLAPDRIDFLNLVEQTLSL
jgi:von Willebrand factor